MGIYMQTIKTKYKLANSLKNLVENYPLEKITVKDIVDGCGLTRQTFYRHFEDKFALVNWYFEILVQDSFKTMNEKNTLAQALENKFQFIEREERFFQVAFQMDSFQSLIEYDYRYILQFYTDIIIHKTKTHLSPELQFSLELYCRGSISQTVGWIKQKNRPTPKEMAELLQGALPNNLRDLLISFS